MDYSITAVSEHIREGKDWFKERFSNAAESIRGMGFRPVVDKMELMEQLDEVQKRLQFWNSPGWEQFAEVLEEERLEAIDALVESTDDESSSYDEQLRGVIKFIKGLQQRPEDDQNLYDELVAFLDGGEEDE